MDFLLQKVFQAPYFPQRTACLFRYGQNIRHHYCKYWNFWVWLSSRKPHNVPLKCSISKRWNACLKAYSSERVRFVDLSLNQLREVAQIWVHRKSKLCWDGQRGEEWVGLVSKCLWVHTCSIHVSVCSHVDMISITPWKPFELKLQLHHRSCLQHGCNLVRSSLSLATTSLLLYLLCATAEDCGNSTPMGPLRHKRAVSARIRAPRYLREKRRKGVF